MSWVKVGRDPLLTLTHHGNGEYCCLSPTATFNFAQAQRFESAAARRLRSIALSCTPITAKQHSKHSRSRTVIFGSKCDDDLSRIVGAIVYCSCTGSALPLLRVPGLPTFPDCVLHRSRARIRTIPKLGNDGCHAATLDTASRSSRAAQLTTRRRE
jgi:hypothetical protein